jgi:glutaminyl-tRNA synthetase
LRAKIDMASPNINMRDPVIYRIRHASHHRTGDAWCIYPMYDFTHCLSDSFERITHSLCTLEFEDHRPLYDWFLDQLGVYHPQQIEFARLNLNYTVMSKRKLLALVREGLVSGWDDPRMPTLRAMRRRGYTPASIRAFSERVGLAKRQNVVDVAMLEHAVREDLNIVAPRAMAVLDPLRVVIENFDPDRVEWLECPYHPDDDSMGRRLVPLTREIFIERQDFMVDPPKKFYRLAPGREVRLRYACLVECVGYDTDERGEVTTVRCTYDPASIGGAAPDGRKIKVTLHWVSASHGVAAEVRLYDRLFTRENPEEEGRDFRECLNPESLKVVPNATIEPALRAAPAASLWQFERLGYFCVDAKDSRPDAPVFNRTVTLRDEWARIVKRSCEG